MAQHELSNKEIIVRLLKSDLSDYDNLLSLLGMANEVIREDKELSRKLANKVRFLALRLCATGDIKYYNFPLDDSMGAPIDEIINCRCVEL